MSSRRVESFVLRVVVQHDAENAGVEAWRGRIQHITTGSERQFDQFRDILTFIAEHLENERENVIILPSINDPL